MIKYNKEKGIKLNNGEVTANILHFADDLGIELSFIESFLTGIESINNHLPYTYDFYVLGQGCYTTAYAYNGFVLKENAKDTEDQDIFKEYGMGLKLNKYSIFPKTYAIIEYGEFYYIVTERVYGIELGEVANNVNILDLDSFTNFQNEINSLPREGVIPMDMHSQNIMIDTNGNVKIIDIGCFKHIEETDYEYGEPIVFDISRQLNNSKRIAEGIENFKNSLSGDFKKENLFIEKSMRGTKIQKSERLLTEEEKGSLIKKFLEVIDKKEYRNLPYVGSGTHSKVYALEHDGIEYVLKVQGGFSEEFCRKQMRIMKSTSVFVSFLENIVYYYNEEEGNLIILQEMLEGTVASSEVPEDIGVFYTKFMLKGFRNDIKSLLTKMNVIANDTHDENVSLVRNNRSLKVFCFDVSYFFELDSIEGEKNVRDYGNNLSDESLLGVTGVSYWMDELYDEVESKEK